MLPISLPCCSFSSCKAEFDMGNFAWENTPKVIKIPNVPPLVTLAQSSCPVDWMDGAVWFFYLFFCRQIYISSKLGSIWKLSVLPNNGLTTFCNQQGEWEAPLLCRSLETEQTKICSHWILGEYLICRQSWVCIWKVMCCCLFNNFCLWLLGRK